VVTDQRRSEPSLKSPVVPPVAAADVTAPVTSDQRTATDTIRVATTKLDAVLLQAEELLSAKLAATQHALQLRQCRAEPQQWLQRWKKLQPDLRAIRHKLDGKQSGNGELSGGSQSQRALEFLQWSHELVESLDVRLATLAETAEHDQRTIASMVDRLLDDVAQVVMQPFSMLLDAFPRFVRELSREQGKTVELAIRGESIQIDRRILEGMKNPLIHLLRNCFDHGIEKPEARARLGKPPVGTITIDICARSGSRVELLVADDGKGIDVAAVKAAAVKAGIVTAESLSALDETEQLSLVFRSGVSSSPIITDLSGRGLGLAIVKEQVEKLNGTLSVETQLDRGTKFRIVLPATLARFRGILLSANQQLFVVPTSNVERVVRVRRAEVKTVENRETIVLGGRTTALVRLDEVLELSGNADAGAELVCAMVLTSGSQRIAFVVDSILGEQEVLLKTLGKQLARVRHVEGATVLGNGKVVPILNVPDLMASAVRAGASGAGRAVVSGQPAQPARQRAVLIADDSITSRILLKGILEAAGYRVDTAFDGVDAITKLRSGDFDLVVSDVEMPRLSGFDLTAKVRADKKFGELPVILVTALDSREDRERGIDVGANAYIVKSSFDQSNLLEIVGRLI
jgi:two-component system chemotaxis sensor kinase CheA